MNPVRYLSSIFLFAFLFVESGFAFAYLDGDLIFHESQSNQSKAIQEATGSRWSHVGILFQEKGNWFVAEAVQPVKVTPLSAFISRGKNKDYQIYRIPNLSNLQIEAVRENAKTFLGKNYDIYFEWSDDLIYCSEFVFKVYYGATGLEIGTIQKFKDLKLDGPYVKELIKRRLEDTGRELNVEENIVTPATQITDSKLKLVEISD